MASREWHERAIEKKLGRCKHYNGTSSATCRAGVNYHDLVGNEPGWGCKLPCTGDGGCDHAPELKVVTCALREFPTREETEKYLDEVTRSMENTVKARQAIIAELKAHDRQTRNVSGTIPCPICNSGTLRFSIAYNGHCHGTCSTSGCVNWME